MIELRPYQNEAVNFALESIEKSGNSLIVAGTGAGKTIMMASFIGKFFTAFRVKNKRAPHILVLVHRFEIHNQNKEKFSLVCPDIKTSEITSDRKSLNGYVHFGMVQTVSNLLDDFSNSGSFFDLIVIDEAHHSAAQTYEKIINWNKSFKKDMKLLGVTATPNRGDKLPLIHLYDNFYQITVRFLINSHYLVRPKFIDLSPSFSDKDGTQKGHLSKFIKNDDLGKETIKNLCNDYLKNKDDGKTVIFAPCHEFCQMIKSALEDMGRCVSYLYPNIDSVSRQEEIYKFEKGDATELINVDICTEGYDYPNLSNIVDFDTNGTHAQWVQKVGRVLRCVPGKVRATVIDFGGNVLMYPEGIDSDVLLEGKFKCEKGKMLTDNDFIKKEGKKQNESYEIEAREDKVYTPYNLPLGFESVNDKDFGVVYVSCQVKEDAIIIATNDNDFILYMTNKVSIKKIMRGSFDDCVIKAISNISEYTTCDKEITKLQIKLLCPEYPTSALTFNGANACLCFKTWKSKIFEI